jgi:hypothetical protein
MPYLMDPSTSPRITRTAAPAARRARSARRALAVVAVVAFGGTLTAAGTARADAVKPISAERVHELTCGHLGTSCSSPAKRKAKKATSARKRSARSRAAARSRRK